MCRNSGRSLKIFWLLLALLLLQPCYSFSDVVLTDAEATQLRQSLLTAKKELTEQQRQIEKLQSTLSEQRSELEKSREELQRSQSETEALKSNLTALSQSWKQQKSEARWAKTKCLLIGLGIGIAGGFVGGYYLANR